MSGDAPAASAGCCILIETDRSVCAKRFGNGG